VIALWLSLVESLRIQILAMRMPHFGSLLEEQHDIRTICIVAQRLHKPRQRVYFLDDEVLTKTNQPCRLVLCSGPVCKFQLLRKRKMHKVLSHPRLGQGVSNSASV
jgi:hypothetical protein